MIPSLLLAAVAAFLAGVLDGFTGFGISVVLVPLPLVVYDKPTVVVLNGMLSATIAAAVARDSCARPTARRRSCSRSRPFRAAALCTVFLIVGLGVATALGALL